MTSTSGIYQICNTTNGHVYIGSAVNLKKRWLHHLGDLRCGNHHSPHLQHAWNKYGQSVFEFSVLEYCEIEKLIEREQVYINQNTPEYNISPTAGSCFGVKRSEATRKKMSIILIGNKRMKGKTISDETKKKISDANKGNQVWVGRTHSSETRIKMSNSAKGRVFSEDHRNKLSQAAKNWHNKNKEGK